MLRNTLQFFDSNGDNLNLRFDNNKDCWVGSLFFPRTSIDIISLKQVLMFSIANYVGEEKLVKPLSRFDLSYEYEFLDLDDSDNDDFSFYSKSNNYIDLSKTLTKDLSKSNFNFDYENNKANLVELEEEPVVISVIFKPTEKKNSSTIMRISYYDEEFKQTKTIVDLFLFGEGEGEDERFPVVMNNLGLDLDITDDTQTFKNSNPKEPLPDWNIINNKRKELLFSYDQIIPFTGSYKAITNAIKYYGYNNITIKEWWKNVDVESELLGKYKAIPIDEQPPQLMLWKKTGLFTLVYQMNKVDYANRGSDGLPSVTEEFDFSSEEILKKLTLLRSKLERHHTPIFSKIVDVVGELTFFTKLTINVWFNDTRIDYIKDKNINFDVDIDYNHVEDLREFGNTPQPKWADMSYNSPISGDYYLGQLNNLNISDINRIHDTNDTVIGSRFELSLRLSSKFIELEQYRIKRFSRFKIKDLKFLLFNSVRWSVYNSKKERVYFVEGDVREFNTVVVTLAVEDVYTVKVEVIDRYNHILNRIKENVIDLRVKEVEFLGFYEYSPDRYKISDFKGRKIKSMNFDFKNSMQQKDRTPIGEINSRLKSLSKLQYWKSEMLPEVRLSDLKVPFKSLRNKKIKFYNTEIPKSPHFMIGSISEGGTIQIGDKIVTFTGLNGVNDYERMAELWNLEFKGHSWLANPIQDTLGNFVDLIVVNRFRRKINLEEISWSQEVILKSLPMRNRSYSSKEQFIVKFIDVKFGDYYTSNIQGEVDLYEASQTLGLTNFSIVFNEPTGVNILFSNNLKWSLTSDKSGYIKDYYNLDFRINNIKWFEFNSEVSRFTRVYFCMDKTKIKGISNKKWTLTKQGTNFIKEVTNKDNFHYFFVDKGIYDLSLEITDNQGNFKKTIKSEIIKVV